MFLENVSEYSVVAFTPSRNYHVSLTHSIMDHNGNSSTSQIAENLNNLYPTGESLKGFLKILPIRESTKILFKNLSFFFFDCHFSS